MKKVLFSAPYMIPFVERFKPVFDHYGIELIEPIVEERMEEEELLKYAGQFDGAICGDDRYTPRVLTACAPRLKVISKWGTGIDSIHEETCAKLGIKIGRTLNAFTLPVADSVLGYMLAFSRKQPWMDKAMKAGVWQKIPGKALHEQVLGIIGVGNIGKAVTRRARAFGMTVYGNDILEIDHVFIAETGIKMVPLDDLIRNSDFISVNCDLNPSSFHLINAESLKGAKPGSILINTARGPIVNEDDLVKALNSGKLFGAALDVFEVEPLPHNSPLISMDNVMIAPHNTNSSPSAWERVHWNTIRNLLEGLDIDSSGLEEIIK
ncbi:MAG TPA: phosphoglycerate dehydrogenase [Anaerolineales bacterium]|nr:phosphoglycerate dehydrogenase [Anaerolineales bacterium]